MLKARKKIGLYVKKTLYNYFSLIKTRYLSVGHLSVPT